MLSTLTFQSSGSTHRRRLEAIGDVGELGVVATVVEDSERHWRLAGVRSRTVPSGRRLKARDSRFQVAESPGSKIWRQMFYDFPRSLALAPTLSLYLSLSLLFLASYITPA